MKELEEQILNYWGNRAEGYSEYNREELAGEKWHNRIERDRRFGSLILEPDLDFLLFCWHRKDIR